MVAVSRHIQAEPSKIFSILADGWTYAGWVVGTSHIRAVDANWPEPGSRMHHAVGPWPLVIRDTTTVSELSPDRHLLLRARIWPAGEADIDLRLDADAPGTAAAGTDAPGTLVTMTETPKGGLLRYLGPLSAGLLRARNTESLGRLAAQAEHRP